MKIPKKISPDRIKDAIVEIRYTSPLHFEVIPGLFFQSLDNTFTYTNRPVSKIHGHGQANVPMNLPGLPGDLIVFNGGNSIFYNDKIKIQVLPNSIIFNIINEYISWENYKPEIEKALKQLQTSAVFEKFTRIGMRYISEYPNHDLHSCVKFDFSFGMPSIKSEKYLFQSEFNMDDLKVILNLKHKQPVISAKDLTQTNAVSIIDIDTIFDNLEITDITELINKIEQVHTKEKDIFFNLLREDFLITLNPEY